MLITFTENIEEEYIKMGQDLEFVKGLQTLRQQLNDSIGGPKLGQLGRRDLGAEVCIQPQGVEMDSMLSGFDFSTDLNNLEDSWSHLWNDDFGTLTSNNGEQDTTNMYLLGIPQSWA